MRHAAASIDQRRVKRSVMLRAEPIGCCCIKFTTLARIKLFAQLRIKYRVVSGVLAGVVARIRRGFRARHIGWRGTLGWAQPGRARRRGGRCRRIGQARFRHAARGRGAADQRAALTLWRQSA
jgi:hypothetical protein